MKRLGVILLTLSGLYASFEYKGKVGTFYQQNLQVKSEKSQNISDIRASFEGDYENEEGDISGHVALDSVYDPNDIKRRYLYLNEAKLQYSGDTFSVEAGNLVENWQQLFTYSANDVYNVLNILKDPLSYEKLGSLGAFGHFYLDDDTLSVGMRFLETLQDVASTNSPYYIFEENATFNGPDSALNFFRPTVFVRYTGVVETETSTIDYGVSVANGFDTMRGISLTSVSTNNVANYTPKLFYSTKLMGYVSVPVESVIFKSEMAVALSEDSEVAHYAQLGVGLEYTTEAWFDANLIYIAEYHYFHQSRDTNTLDDTQLFQLFQNDIALGVNVAFNDIYASTLTALALVDVEYIESSYQLAYTSKLSDSIGFTIKATKVVPTHSFVLTLYKRLQDFTAVSVLLGYSY